MGWVSHRVERESLRPGDHIYTWRAIFSYAHHGIYVGDNKVIHFTVKAGRGLREPGTGTPLDHRIARSVASCSHVSCPTRGVPVVSHGVVIRSCLDCFLNGGKLYRYEYSVNIALFLAKLRAGTCSRAVSDADNRVIYRATYLLHNGFGSYNVCRNCKNFAVYCKTGLLVRDQRMMGHSGQTIGAIASPFALGFATLQGIPALIRFASPEWAAFIASIAMPVRLLFLPMISIYPIAISALLIYCLIRLNADIRTRRDVDGVSVYDFASVRLRMN